MSKMSAKEIVDRINDIRKLVAESSAGLSDAMEIDTKLLELQKRLLEDK